MDGAVSAERECGQACLFDLEQGQVCVFMQPNKSCLNDALSANRRNLVGIADGGHSQSYVDALRSFHHVGIGDDVSVGVDDHSRANYVLACQERRLTAAVLL